MAEFPELPDDPMMGMLERDILEKKRMKRAFIMTSVIGVFLFLCIFFSIWATLINRQYNKQNIRETLENRYINQRVQSHLDTLIKEVRLNRQVFRAQYNKDSAYHSDLKEYNRITHE